MESAQIFFTAIHTAIHTCVGGGHGSADAILRNEKGEMALLHDDALLSHLLGCCVHEPGRPTRFPHFGETRFVVDAFDVATKGISEAELKALGAGTLEAAPVDWHAPMFRMAGLVSERGACRSCGDALFASTLPPPPPEAGREDAWAATVGLRLRREAANALDHLTRCGANACASCGAIDYKLLRALCLQAVSAEQRAALLLPKHNLFGDYRVDLRGLGRPSVDVFRTLDRGSDTQCSACCCGSAASSGSDGTRVHRRTGTAVRETRTPRAVTVSIAPHGESSCRTCGRRGTVAAPLKYCARCRDVLYCSRDCQVADWPTHRGSCNQAG